MYNKYRIQITISNYYIRTWSSSRTHSWTHSFFSGYARLTICRLVVARMAHFREDIHIIPGKFNKSSWRFVHQISNRDWNITGLIFKLSKSYILNKPCCVSKAQDSKKQIRRRLMCTISAISLIYDLLFILGTDPLPITYRFKRKQMTGSILFIRNRNRYNLNWNL